MSFNSAVENLGGRITRGRDGQTIISFDGKISKAKLKTLRALWQEQFNGTLNGEDVIMRESIEPK